MKQLLEVSDASKSNSYDVDGCRASEASPFQSDPKKMPAQMRGAYSAMIRQSKVLCQTIEKVRIGRLVVVELERRRANQWVRRGCTRHGEAGLIMGLLSIAVADVELGPCN